jgi:two-component system, OmpR family, alkaline phosphatase synthesis response regulator PhoP
MPEIKVLIADDDKGFLTLMSKKITEVGYTVLTAQDGQEAEARIAADSPDVIILDISMPKLDGLSVLKHLREQSIPSKETWQPVIIVSGHKDLEQMTKAYNLQADHYITKPCSVEDITKSIELMVSLIPYHNEEYD